MNEQDNNEFTSNNSNNSIDSNSSNEDYESIEDSYINENNAISISDKKSNLKKEKIMTTGSKKPKVIDYLNKELSDKKTLYSLQIKENIADNNINNNSSKLNISSNDKYYSAKSRIDYDNNNESKFSKSILNDKYNVTFSLILEERTNINQKLLNSTNSNIKGKKSEINNEKMKKEPLNNNENSCNLKLNIEIVDSVLYWKTFSSSYSNEELNQYNNVWSEDTIEDKFDLIKSVFNYNELTNKSFFSLSIKDRNIDRENLIKKLDKNIFDVSIPYTVGKKHKYINLKVEKKEMKHSYEDIVAIFKKLKVLYEEKYNFNKKYEGRINKAEFVLNNIEDDLKKLKTIEGMNMSLNETKLHISRIKSSADKDCVNFI